MRAKPVSGLRRHLAERLTKIIMESGIVEPATARPVAMHRFLVVLKPQTKVKRPVNKASFDAMLTTALESVFRCVINSSTISAMLYRSPHPDPPTIFETLSKIEANSLKTCCDLKRVYNQTRATEAAKRLFAFETCVVGVPIAWLSSIPQGCAESARCNQKVSSHAVERQNNMVDVERWAAAKVWYKNVSFLKPL